VGERDRGRIRSEREDAVGSRQQAVGREEKERKFRRLGKKSAGKARHLSPFGTVPIRHPVILGTTAKKADKIRPVRLSMTIINLSLITRRFSLSTNVKMLHRAAGLDRLPQNEMGLR